MRSFLTWLGFVLLVAAAKLSAYEIIGSVYVTDGSFGDVKNAVNDVPSLNGFVSLPPGEHPGWGAGGQISTSKAVTIYGAGKTATVLNGITTGSPTFFSISGAATIRDMTINGGTSGTNIFYVTGPEGTNIGARFTNLKLDFTGNKGSRMFDINRVYFVAWDCEFVGGGGNNEYIYMRGPYDAWDHAANPGTDQAVYFENCILAGQGYPDSNACGRIVFRMCLITAPTKLDTHGIDSNLLPVRSSRSMEAYGNRWLWTSTSVGSMKAIEHRGGVGYFFDNIVDASAGAIGTFHFRNYGYIGQWNAYSKIYQTPYRYPTPDQIGTGPGTIVPNGSGGTQVAGAEPTYFWSNLKNGARATVAAMDVPADLTWINTDAAGYAAGVTSITVTGAVPTANWVPAGNYFSVPGDTTRYLITTGTSVSPGTITFTPALVNPIPAVVTNVKIGPITTYQGLMGNPTATWTANDLLQPDREYFTDGASFNGTSGIGRGTRAQMDAIAINGFTKKVGVGFWVTNEGTWNQSFSGTVNAPALEVGDYCEIVSSGDTNWIAMGARANTVGTWFWVQTVSPSTVAPGTAKPRQGRLYTWSGSAFVLKYTPYTYPHPLRDTGPDVTAPVATAAIAASGLVLTLALSEAGTADSGTGGVTLTASGGPVAATYASGNGTTAWNYALNRIVIGTEVVTWDFDGDIRDAAGNAMAAVDDGAVYNGSTETVIDASPNPWRSAVVPGIF